MRIARSERLTAKQQLFFVRAVLLFLGITAAELLHTASRVDEHVLAGVEGVRSAAHFDFHQRIRFAVFHRDGVGRLHRGTGDELKIRGSVLKHDFLILGVGLFFHIGGQFYQLNPADFAEGTAKVRLSSRIPNCAPNIFPANRPADGCI